MIRPETRHTGSCHCGAVVLELTLPDGIVNPRRCDCSICRRKNALMVQVHESKFVLLAGEESLTEYNWHTGTARHFFCKTCGIYPFHRKRSAPDSYGVNVFCLDDFAPDGIPVRLADGKGMD